MLAELKCIDVGGRSFLECKDHLMTGAIEGAHATIVFNPDDQVLELIMVLSDECEPVSVDRKFQEFMQHRVAATQQEQLHVEPYMFL